MSRETVGAVAAFLAASPKLRALDRTGIDFNRLFAPANMAIQRFGSVLVSKGQFGSYMALSKSALRDANLEQVMCRSLLGVDWRGTLYDCDFNQQLGLPRHAARAVDGWATGRGMSRRSSIRAPTSPCRNAA